MLSNGLFSKSSQLDAPPVPPTTWRLPSLSTSKSLERVSNGLSSTFSHSAVKGLPVGFTQTSYSELSGGSVPTQTPDFPSLPGSPLTPSKYPTIPSFMFAI